jgi:hypothetical protein
MPTSSPPLRDLQKRLAAYILRRARGGGETDAELQSWLRLPTGTSPAERLRVYADGYPARLHEALEEAFPALVKILGASDFAELAWRYIARTNLGSYNLNDAGSRFAEFCADDIVSDTLPFAGDLARVEWHVIAALHARDTAPVNPALFSTWSMQDWERATLRFQPSLALLRSAWPIHDLWECREMERDEIDVDLRDRPQVVAVRREGFRVRCTVADRIEAIALESLLAGGTLGDTVERLAELGEAPETVMERFAAWMKAGLITELSAAD